MNAFLEMCSDKDCGYLVKRVQGSTTPAVKYIIDAFDLQVNCPGPGIMETQYMAIY